MRAVQALKLIREHGAAKRYRLDAHALERMRARRITPQDLRAVLQYARRCAPQPDGRWRVFGEDLDGRARSSPSWCSRTTARSS